MPEELNPRKCQKLVLKDQVVVVCMDDSSGFWIELYELRMLSLSGVKRNQLGNRILTSDHLRYDTHVRYWIKRFFFPDVTEMLSGEDAEFQDKATEQIMETYHSLDETEVILPS